MSRQTYVSGVFHLARRDQTTRRPPDFLLRHGAYVLSLPVPMVLFCDPEFEEPCARVRSELDLGDMTRIVCKPLELFDFAALVELLPRFPVARNLDCVSKETPWHQVMQWSKLDMVKEAIDSNPFETDHFAWIDFSIAHVAAPMNSLPAVSQRVALLEMLPVAPVEVENRKEFYQWERGRLAGGFFRGHKHFMLDFRSLFEAELAAALAVRTRPNEQMIYSLLSARHPELFEPYYGDYVDILRSWDLPRSSIELVMANALFCRHHNLWDKALRVCTAVESAQKAGELSLDDEQTALWLDEFYQAAWYGGKKVRCAELGERLGSLSSTDYFQQHSERLRGNLSLLGAN